MSDAQLDKDYIRHLEAENERLRERVRSLEETFGYRSEQATPIFLGLTASESSVFAFLMKRDSVATKEQIMNAIYFDRPWIDVEIKIVDVFVCKIRKKVEKFGIKIDTVWGRGYILPKESRAIIAKLMKPETENEQEASQDSQATA